MQKSTALTITTHENVIKKTYNKRFAIPLDFDFFRHPVHPYELKENSIVRLELNSAEKIILCTVDTNATYKFSNILLEYDAIFDEPYCYRHRQNVCWNVDSVYQGNTNPLPDII